MNVISIPTKTNMNQVSMRNISTSTSTSSMFIPIALSFILISYSMDATMAFQSQSKCWLRQSQYRYQYPTPSIRVTNNIDAARSIRYCTRLASIQNNYNENLNHSIITNEQNIDIDPTITTSPITNPGDDHDHHPSPLSSRRQTLQFLATSAAALSLVIAPQSANAGKAEIDSKSGELFSPKNEMLGGGGSDLARGIKMQSRNRDGGGSGGSASSSRSSSAFGMNGAPIQNVYETRFITYLSRFLLNYDPAAGAWWEEQQGGFQNNGKMTLEAQKKIRFAEFAESVEVGLADYFVGPYGSYASVQAAKAGLLAQQPATSSSSSSKAAAKPTETPRTGLFDVFKNRGKAGMGDKETRENARKGILNLFALLQARYNAPEEKRQLAILFSLISDPYLQPSKEIKGILGEADNGSISSVKLVGLLMEGDNFRRSSRQGGGYSIFDTPRVVVDPPPALGSGYKSAKFKATTKPTSRVLRIRVLDGGRGYTSIPRVEVTSSDVKIPCDATAILDRKGSVESVIVLDPGFGYGKNNKRSDVAPEVIIAPPKRPRGSGKVNKDLYKPAIAVADLEYAVDTINIIDGGNGYVLNQPPKAYLEPPDEDADWYFSAIDRKTWRPIDAGLVEVDVRSMTSKTTGEKIEMADEPGEEDMIASDPSILESLERDPLALLPSTLRPHFTPPLGEIPESGLSAGKAGNFRILSIPTAPPSMFMPSLRYRAFDPVFGAIGSKPVTKNARTLTGSEYTRLALSGSICTVVVRTALNPLELVKTKIQLKNDEELMQAIAKKPSPVADTESTEVSQESEENTEATAGTLDVMKAMTSMRGPQSLFQSADITFLASVVFGSFGFGATELFRRSFTAVFFPESTGGMKSGEEFIVLIAAALACILTSLAAAPFEILRVRSMGYVEATPVSQVFSDFLGEKREQKMQKKGKGTSKPIIPADADHHENGRIQLSSIRKDDIPPLFSGFLPIVSRELPFAVVKFLAFDIVASSIISIINSQPQIIEPVQVGAGTIGLAVSAASGAIAGLAGAFVSHPADLILTLTSSKQKSDKGDKSESGNEEDDSADWRAIVKELISKEGGIGNLYAGFPARSTFFFLVIGLQFFLYDYAKNVFQVGSEDLTLVLDVFYAIRQGLT